MQSTTHDLKAIGDDELMRRLVALVAASRHAEADLVAHIGEVDARRLYLRQATPSMFVYCTERLHLSEAEACLRIAAGRASRAHPVLLDMLADGRLHLSAIAKLARHLTPENRDELLGRATHKSKREIDELVAEIAPRPDTAAVIRKLPALVRKVPAGRFVARPLTDRFGSDVLMCPGGGTSPPGAGLPSAAGQPGAAALPSAAGVRASGHPKEVVRPERVDSDRSDGAGDACSRPEGEARSRIDAPPGDARRGTGPRWVPARPRPAVIEPLAPSRYKVQFTASAELRDKLERLQALMRSSIPDGDLGAVIEAAVTEKLERLEARRFGRTKSPRKSISTSDTSARTRHVPAAVKRAVSERDEGRCRYVDAEGHRCAARVSVELHHRNPWAVGGDHSPENLSSLCRSHHRLMTEVDFGLKAVGERRGSRLTSRGAQMELTTS